MPGRVGAALTKPGRTSTARWCWSGEREGEEYERNRRCYVPPAVQVVLKLVLEPIFEAEFEPVSYGFRPKIHNSKIRAVTSHPGLSGGSCAAATHTPVSSQTAR